ncbi:ABC transporter permease [Streptomyces sp. H27-D2]|uniref:ABC transporter permease n=1 Tax=Streptomyces sp. H27-D2 TaxID=3046304 RepID=UPI002DB87C0D|nr:ABC transporter permease [Streptomyces sp. H27-D2]MEC4017922.1 ABC transporter permease [Streptomyces sp. H27-D2]
MTAPLTPPGRPPHGRHHDEQPEDQQHGSQHQHEQQDEHDHPHDDHWQKQALGSGPAYRTPKDPSPAQELRQAAVVAVLVAVAGVLLGLLWLWLSPRIPLVSNGKAIFLKNSEGEEAIGADGTFVLLALAFGALSAVAVFWFFRRGGIAIVLGLALGGLLGSLLAWRLGLWLGPTEDVVAHAKAVGKGVTFDAGLQLRAKGALLGWSLAAVGVHLGLTAMFGPREPEPSPDWPGHPTVPPSG